MIQRLIYTICLLLVCTIQAKGFTIVIDAGHGGMDPGAMGSTSKEKNINLKVALAFGRLVEKNCPEVKVIYTRKTDTFITLDERAQIANKAKADLFISIHTNALPKNKRMSGAETYTLGMHRADENLEVAKRENSAILIESDYKARYQGFNPNSSESYIMFEFMQDRNMQQSVNFARHMQREFKVAGRADRGVHQAGFLVLRATSMPSALIELGYISTPSEEQFLASSAGQEKMGRAIYNAFLAYYKPLSKKPKTAPQPTTTTKENTKPEPAVEKPAKAEEKPAKTEEKPAKKAEQPAKTPEKAPAKTKEAPAKTPEKPAKAEEKPTKTPEIPAKTEEKPAKAEEEKPVKAEETPTPKAEEKAEDVAPTPIAEPKKDASTVTFRVQFMAGDNLIKTAKGVTNFEYYKEEGLYKYTTGRYATFAEAQKRRNQLAKIYKGAFVVAFQGDERISVQQANQILKK